MHYWKHDYTDLANKTVITWIVTEKINEKEKRYEEQEERTRFYEAWDTLGSGAKDDQTCLYTIHQ